VNNSELKLFVELLPVRSGGDPERRLVSLPNQVEGFFGSNSPPLGAKLRRILGW